MLDENEWVQFVVDKGNEFDIKQQVEQIIRLWNFLKQYSVKLPITQIIDETIIQLAWNSSENYLEINFLPNNKITWFYKNKMTGLLEGTEDNELVNEPSQRFFDLVMLF